VLFAQPRKDSCLLYAAKSGDAVKIVGTVFAGGHDTFIRPVGCEENPSNRVILVWADDPLLATGKAQVRRDADFSRFNELLSATFPMPPNSVGTGQSRYRVVAEFEGRLEISNEAGLKRDPKTGKVTGLDGFGHPMPFTKFRLVATSVSRVEATEEQRPSAAK
jgi:hypothetical protein